MVSHINIPTLSTILIVEDSNLPPAVFAVEGGDENRLYQYVRLDILPEELREAVRKAVWVD